MSQKKKKSKSKKVANSNQMDDSSKLVDNKQMVNNSQSDNSKHREDRVDWLRNQAIIQETYISLIQKLKRCPTVLEVSAETKLSISAIKNHVKEMKFEPQQSPLRSLTPDVLISIYNSSRKGQPASQKLWMQIMEGWKENMGLDLSGGVTIIHDDIK
jgi:hypothetical protein